VTPIFSHRFARARKPIVGMHPTAAGHGLIAEAWLKAVGA
jgi:lysophospholipase L1-like esterase